MAENFDPKNTAQRDLHKLCDEITGKRSMLCFFAGSSVEIPEPQTGRADLGIDYTHCDIDMMYYSTYIYALDLHQPVPEAVVGEIKRICTYRVPNGYCRLIGDRDAKEKDMHADFVNIKPFGALSSGHGPAFEANFAKMFQAYETNLQNYFQCSSFDSVFSVHSPFWPAQANEWVSRKRLHKFPTKSLVKRIVGYGCDLVKASPKVNVYGKRYWNDGVGKDLYWRFSFSMAEYILIRSWTPSQRIVYRTLRSLHKIMITKHGSSKLCTYYFKTLMLWECERRKPEFWHRESLATSVGELFDVMIDYLKNKSCPNYFIPSNNMMGHLSETDITSEIHILQETIQDQDSILKVLKRSEYSEMFTLHAQHQVVRRSYYYRCSLMFANVFTSAIPTNVMNNETFIARLHVGLETELYELCQGLGFQRQARECTSDTENNVLFSRAQQHFDIASRLYSSSEICHLDFSHDPFISERFAWILKFINEQEATRQYLPGTDVISSLHPKFVAKAKQWNANNSNQLQHHDKSLPQSRETNVEEAWLYSVFHDKDTSRTYYSEGLFPNLPGFKPTVNLSWFVTQAYRANLICTTAQDYESVKEIYTDVVECYEASMMHKWFADLMLPVSVSTLWSSIYDDDIQCLIGFYSLCSFLHDAIRDREVHLGVCPLQFLVYLKLRCAMDRKMCSDIEKITSDWWEHVDKCTDDKNANNARIVLTIALRIRGLNINSERNCKLYA